jgi:hypothetical protein
MHDDHFLVIETAQSWLDHASYNNWFRESALGQEPTILNFFYAGIHYFIFLFMSMTGLDDPQVKMLFVRLIHAIWSLVIVSVGFKLTLKLAGDKPARLVGLLLALLWIFPFFSVRNLVEYVCIPFLMLGFWHLYSSRDGDKALMSAFLSGLMFGFAFTFRFQTAIIPAVAGLIILLEKRWKETLLLGAGFLLIPLVFHGLADWIIWGRPFREFQVYIAHNIEHRYDYNQAPWYLYLTVLTGFLLIPVSIVLLWGFLQISRKHPLLFWPVLAFLVFHSAFPNKQERFILPIVPFVIMTGVIGWEAFIGQSSFWRRRPSWNRAMWAFFWVLNFILLIPFSTTYSKKARVESMTYLSRYPLVEALVLDDIHRSHAPMMPFFYLKQWPEVLEVNKEVAPDRLKDRLAPGGGPAPAFVLFFSDKDLESRLGKFKEMIPGLVPEAVILPGVADRLLHRVNPVNANETVYIYRNSQVYPDRVIR